VSSSWTVIGPRVAVEVAGPETAPVVKTNLLGLPTVMATGLVVTGENPPLDAVRV
jgi:hypothetical protein